jgi:hypothetical protein
MMKLLAECQTDAMKPGGRERVRKRAMSFEQLYVAALEGIPEALACIEKQNLKITEVEDLIRQLHSIANGGRE